jgi:sensor histidine kinase YesM
MQLAGGRTARYSLHDELRADRIYNAMNFTPRESWRVLARRLMVTLGFATMFGLLLSLSFVSPTFVVLQRAWVIGVGSLLAFCILERWPRHLKAWLARWVLQLIGVVLAIPCAALLAYWISMGGSFGFLHDKLRLQGLASLTLTGIFFAPWIALGAIVRQREAFARGQQSAFDQERGKLEREALEARMRLLQAQVQPHFLFNTLANVQALVDTGSPKASQVLGTLIAYLRAAVPLLDEPFSTLRDELALARAYLELMHLRMPDRLEYSIHACEESNSMRCPPLTLLTLVENAVRHGIDPSEEGGRIDIHVQLWDQRCRVLVTDTGIGLQAAGRGLGTGLATLRERLQLSFGAGTGLKLTEVRPHGVCAELLFPAQRSMPWAFGQAH